MTSEQTLGSRLRALREAIDISQEALCVRSVAVAAALGGQYRSLDRPNYVAIEKGRLQLTLDSQRRVICGVLDITRDELGEYLDGRLPLADVLVARAARLRRAARAAAKARPRARKGRSAALGASAVG